MPLTGTLTFYRTYFLESEVIDGDYINAPSTYTITREFDGLYAREIAEAIKNEGLTFKCTGSDWASNPDGSYTSNYSTGEMCEVSAHLNADYPTRLLAAIIRKVG